ncbi:MAG: DNA polymerase I [Defluviicoccus sp.]
MAGTRHLILVDGSGYIFRAFHKLPPMTRPDGTPVNAVYGYTTMLMKLLRESAADHFAVIFDAARHTFRNDLYPAYKAHRPEPPDELIPQFALVREATRAFNVPSIESPGFEADDLIATYARLAQAAGAHVTIISADKDLMQLIGPGVAMQDPVTGRPIRDVEVREKFGVGPDRVIDLLALAGDTADNVPGVPGIGVKTAAQLIGEFGDLEQVLMRAGEIRQPKRRQTLIDHAADARLSRELVRLRDDVPVPEPLSALAVRSPDWNQVVAFLEAQAFRSLIARLDLPKAEATAATAAPTIGAAEAGYALVQNVDQLADWIARAREQGIVTVDTETTALDPALADLVGLSLALAPGAACYVPLAHLNADGSPIAEQIPRDQALAALKPLLEDPAVLKIGQNIKYDMRVLAAHDIQIAPIDDTMLLSYALAGGAHGHGLDELAQLHLGHTTIKFADVAGSGKAQVTFDRVPLDRAFAYAAEDADITLRLHRELKPALLSERLVTVYETLERPLVPVLAAMESKGVLVDADHLRALSIEFADRLGVLEVEIHRQAGRRFNIASPKQLGEVLFDEMGLAGGKRGKTGAYATGADVLEQLAAEGHPLPAKVLDWRQLAKLKSTYTDALVQQVNPRTGRVHTSYQQAVASTGRLSSTDPNLQNIPVRTEEGRKIRRAFIAAPGSVLLSADYSQIELRLLAHVADIEALKQAFSHGQDIHALTASQVFGVPVEGMDPMIRRKAKAINFGIIYGISAFGLARQLGISRGEASAYIDAYFSRYPGIRSYMERTKTEARAKGYVTTLFGRRCYVRGIADKNQAVRNFAERAAINAPIQGGAADIIKRAMIRLPAAFARTGLNGRMILQVHDELVFEVPTAETDETRSIVAREMACVAQLDIPLVLETGIGYNWEEAH